MATVTSYTKGKIDELAANWQEISDEQDELDATLDAVKIKVDQHDETLTTLTGDTIPELSDRVNAAAISSSNITETLIPNIESDIDDIESDLNDLHTVTLPEIVLEMDRVVEAASLLTLTFFSPTPPESTDDRDLLVGDIWKQSFPHPLSAEIFKQYFWDGTQWVMFADYILDGTIAVRKIYSSEHKIY